MNKFLLPAIAVILLVGCGEAKKDPQPAEPQTPSEQPMPTQSQPPANGQSEAVKTEPAQKEAAATENEAKKDTQQPEKTEAAKDADKNASSPDTQQPPVATDNSAVPVIDGTNEQTLTESLDKMIVGLTEEQKEAFSEAFLMYAMSQVDMTLSESENQKKMLAALNGKSVQDIMKEAEKLKEQLASSPQAEKPAADSSEYDAQETTKPAESEGAV